MREGCDEDTKYGWSVQPHMLHHVSAEIKIVCFQIHRAEVGLRNLETEDGSKAICHLGGRGENGGGGE